MRTPALAALLGILIPASSLASWPSDPVQNLPICTANGTQNTPFTIADGAGGVIFIWADQRNHPPLQNLNGIYAQRVDVNGFSQWTLNGSPVLVNSTDNTNIDAACTDGAGGAYVAWLNNTKGGTLRLQHILANGIPSWDAQGLDIAISAVNGSGIGIACALVPDGSSGVFVVWRSREGSNSFGIRAQHLDADGTRGWGPSGVLLRSAGSVVPQAPRAVGDGQGGALATWQDGSGGTGWEIRCQHVLSSGVITMDPAGALIAAAPNRFGIVTQSDGAQGAIVAWSVRESPSISRVRAQRVGPTGTMLWPAPGVELGSNTLTTAGELVSCGSGAGDVIVAWKQVDLEEGTRAQAQKVAVDGTLAWAPGGVTVSRPRDVDMLAFALDSDGAGGAYLAYMDETVNVENFTYRDDLAAARLTASGETPWGPNGLRISDAAGDQEFPSLAPDGVGGAYIGWRDRRFETSPDGASVYAQNVHADGTMGGGLASVGTRDQASWARVWPQPSRSQVELAFTSPGGVAAVTIVDPQGRRIRELLRETVPPGETRLRWDGLDGSGVPVRAGLYLAAIVTGGREITRKIVLER